MAPGKMSDFNCFALPTETQPFFSAYASSIEAFIYATAVQKKVTVGAEAFPIPADYVPKMPLTYPPVVFKMRGKQSKATNEALKTKFDKQGIAEVPAKGEPIFLISRPDFTALSNVLPAIAMPNIQRNAANVQVETGKIITTVYQCIDLFLATNTYPYKPVDFEVTSKGDTVTNDLALKMELRSDASYWRSGYGAKKFQRTESTAAIPGRKIDNEEPEDLTPHFGSICQLGGSVYVAKPSPIPSTINHGLPSSVPNKGGICFPYFDGMLQPDANDLRDLIGRTFFRNLGPNPKDAYKTLRSAIGDMAGTIQGSRLHHIMKGVRMALEAQSQLFLMFDDEKYLGFVMLGEHFRVFLRGDWHEPEKAADLQKTLKRIKNLDATLDDLVDSLAGLVMESGDAMMVGKKDIDTSIKLAFVLSKVKIEHGEGDTQKEYAEKISRVCELIRRCSFKTDYQTMKPGNITALLRAIAVGKLPEGLPVFISSKPNLWSIYGKVYGLGLAAFGPTAPSFRGSKGEEIKILPKGSKDNKIEEMTKDDKHVVESLIVYEKPLQQAFNDMKTFIETAKIRSDPKERMAGVRAHVFKGESRTEIFNVMMGCAAKKIIGVAPESEKKKKMTVTIENVEEADVLAALALLK